MRGHQGGVCRAMVSRRGQLARVFCEHSAVEGIDLIREHRHLSKEVIATKTIKKPEMNKKRTIIEEEKNRKGKF